MREDVAATYDRWQRDPGVVFNPEDMVERMRRRHAARLEGDA